MLRLPSRWWFTGGSPNPAVFPGSTIGDVVRRDAVLLTDDGGRLSGIVTDKDIMGRVVAEGINSGSCQVALPLTQPPQEQVSCETEATWLCFRCR